MSQHRTPQSVLRKSSVFQHEHFTLKLPAGWQFSDFKPGRKKRFVPAPAKPGAEKLGEACFADRHGNYFMVFVDPATDFEADAIWEVNVGKDGSSVRVVREGAMCRRPADPTYEGPCSAGNGTLEIGTLPSLDIRGHAYGFRFGNTEREIGVDLAPFRAILRSFRAR